MKIIKLKCTNCDGFTEIKLENNQKMAFCPYCGQKYIIDDEKVYVEVTHNVNINKTERKIDDARIKEAEVKEKIRLRELELEEKRRKGSGIWKFFKVILSIFLSLIGTILVLVGIFGGPSIEILAFIGFFIFMAIYWLWSKK